MAYCSLRLHAVSHSAFHPCHTGAESIMHRRFLAT
jgi:hypothetical protein